jgi:acyl carrier protein
MEKGSTRELLEEIVAEFGLDDFEDADSLEQLEIKLAAEKHFKIEIPDKVLVGISSLDELARAVDAAIVKH